MSAARSRLPESALGDLSHPDWGSVDALDVRILRELVWGLALSPLALNLRISLGDLARKLGADEGTVRNRVRGYRESGFIREWRTILNPTLLGGQEIAVWLGPAASIPKDKVVEAARLLPGVAIINLYHGDDLEVIVRSRDEASGLRAVEMFLRFAEPQWRLVGRIQFPPCDLELSATDRAILRSLEAAPRKSAVAVSHELGIATRTVRRRLHRLIDGQAVFALPRIDPKALRGDLMVGLLVTCSADRRRETVAALFAELDEHLWHARHAVPLHANAYHPSFYHLFVPNLAKARELLRRAHDLPGVAECRLELFEDIETHYETFAGDLERLAGRP